MVARAVRQYSLATYPLAILRAGITHPPQKTLGHSSIIYLTNGEKHLMVTKSIKSAHSSSIPALPFAIVFAIPQSAHIVWCGYSNGSSFCLPLPEYNRAIVPGK